MWDSSVGDGEEVEDEGGESEEEGECVDETDWVGSGWRNKNGFAEAVL